MRCRFYRHRSPNGPRQVYALKGQGDKFPQPAEAKQLLAAVVAKFPEQRITNLVNEIKAII